MPSPAPFPQSNERKLNREAAVRAVRGLLSCFSPRFKVLVYHSINRVSKDPYEVDETAFSAQMQMLVERGYRVLDLAAAVRGLARGRITRRSVVITFDDGFASLSDHALPVLERYGLTATVFLPVAYLGGIDGFSYAEPLPDRRIMSWEAVEAGQRQGIRFGSHTMTHPNLVGLSNAALTYELAESKRILTERLGLDFMALAYPFGGFDGRVKQVAAAAGYDCAMCFGNILSNTRFTDLLELKREKILAATSLAEFADLIDVRRDFFRKFRHDLKRTALLSRFWPRMPIGPSYKG